MSDVLLDTALPAMAAAFEANYEVSTIPCGHAPAGAVLQNAEMTQVTTDIRSFSYNGVPRTRLDSRRTHDDVHAIVAATVGHF